MVTPPRKSLPLRASDLSALPQGEGWQSVPAPLTSRSACRPFCESAYKCCRGVQHIREGVAACGGFVGTDLLDHDRTGVTLTIDFEIGIPLLAQMLNPVAQRSLRANCTEMLEGIERDAIATALT